MEGLLIALLIELGNRFGPEAIFKFIFFAAGSPLVLPLHLRRLRTSFPPRILSLAFSQGKDNAVSFS